MICDKFGDTLWKKRCHIEKTVYLMGTYRTTLTCKEVYIISSGFDFNRWVSRYDAQ